LIRDPGWVKNQDPDPGSGSGINILDHISENLETIFWVKRQIFLMQIRIRNLFDPGTEIRDGKSEIPDPQH
jgi:hypothetical protein